MRRGEWRGLWEGLERWPDSYVGSGRVELFGHPNMFGAWGLTL
jgi:hypothetical protein